MQKWSWFNGTCSRTLPDKLQSRPRRWSCFADSLTAHGPAPSSIHSTKEDPRLTLVLACARWELLPSFAVLSGSSHGDGGEPLPERLSSGMQPPRGSLPRCLFNGCSNQEIWWPFLFKGLIIGTCSYFGAYSGRDQEGLWPVPFWWRNPHQNRICSYYESFE
jgi:hypothetical protein